MTRAYGLDLAGYSTTGSALAAADDSGEGIVITVLDDHCFSVAAGGTSSLADKTHEEIACLDRLIADATALYVDVPIDLQGLPNPDDPELIWELTKRPVDQAFGALCPLADRIGSYVARMQNLWQMLKQNSDPLGSGLFETYPAASLTVGKQCSKGYKGQATRNQNKWIGVGTNKEAEQKKNDKLAELLNKLNWQAEDKFHFSNDEFDAALCALCGVSPRLDGDELADEMNRRIGGNRSYMRPQGYVLLKGIPEGVTVCRKSYQEWFNGGAE